MEVATDLQEDGGVLAVDADPALEVVVSRGAEDALDEPAALEAGQKLRRRQVLGEQRPPLAAGLLVDAARRQLVQQLRVVLQTVHVLVHCRPINEFSSVRSGRHPPS